MSMLKKVFLLISTGVCGIIGITIIALGAKEIMEGQYLDNFAKEHRYITAVFISLGVIIFAISATGFVGIILQSTLLLRIYAYMMLTLVVVQVLIGFIILLLIDRIRNAMVITFGEKFKSYEKNKYDIDQLQLTLKCCGMSGARNWNITSLPASCCGLNTGKCEVASAYADSCTEKGEKALVFTLYFVSIGSLLVVLIEIICIILACCLSNLVSSTPSQQSAINRKRKRSTDSSSSSSSSSTNKEEYKKDNK